MKRLLTFIFFLLLFFFLPKQTFAADENFFVSISTNYKVSKDGVMSMNNTIEIVNQKTEIYSPSFKFSVSKMKPDNLTAFEAGVALPVSVTEEGDNSIIEVTFKRAVVGKGARRRFTLNLTDTT